MTDLSPILLSIMMIGSFLLAAGGFYMIAKGRNGRQGVLMLIAALVMLGNVLIWTV
jgi:hypothetical protein